MPRIRRKSEIRAAAERKATVLSQFRRGSSPMAACWRGLMVAALMDGQSVTAAARAAGVSRAAAYKARERDPRFAKAWDEALPSPKPEDIPDPWEPERIPIFRGGIQVGYKERYDLNRLLRMARGAASARARSRSGLTMEEGGLPQFSDDVACSLSTLGNSQGRDFSHAKSAKDAKGVL